MVVRSIVRTVILSILLGAVAVAGQAPPHAAPNPGRTPYFPPRGNSFVDFAVNKFNPCGADYGQVLDDARRIAVEETIENAYFWSNIVSLLFVLGFGAGVIFLLKQRDERLKIVAGFLACYHNQLVDAEEVIDQYAERYGRLVEDIDDQADATQVAAQPTEPRTPGTQTKDGPRQEAAQSAQGWTEEKRKLLQELTRRDVIIEDLKRKVQQRGPKTREDQDNNSAPKDPDVDGAGEEPKDVS